MTVCAGSLQQMPTPACVQLFGRPFTHRRPKCHIQAEGQTKTDCQSSPLFDYITIPTHKNQAQNEFFNSSGKQVFILDMPGELAHSRHIKRNYPFA